MLVLCVSALEEKQLNEYCKSSGCGCEWFQRKWCPILRGPSRSLGFKQKQKNRYKSKYKIRIKWVRRLSIWIVYFFYFTAFIRNLERKKKHERKQLNIYVCIKCGARNNTSAFVICTNKLLAKGRRHRHCIKIEMCKTFFGEFCISHTNDLVVK